MSILGPSKGANLSLLKRQNDRKTKWRTHKMADFEKKSESLNVSAQPTFKSKKNYLIEN